VEKPGQETQLYNVHNMDLKLLIALLPAVFMLHDFEEIIFIQPWLNKNKNELALRFPFVGRRIIKIHGKLSTSALSVAVAQMFFLVSIVTYTSLYFGIYQWWWGCFMVFSIHLFGHIFQWLVYGKYVPAVVTSILAMPYCIYTYLQFIERTKMDLFNLVLWTIVGFAIVVPYLLSALYLAQRFEGWKTKYFGA
jgi:hypothetical protein